MADDPARRAYIAANVSADLQYVLDEAETSLANQYNITQHYKTLKMFAAMADTKNEIRNALRDDFHLDQAASAANRAEVARVVTAWEISKELATKEHELRAESKVLGMPRTLQHSERQAMLKAVETVVGRLQDAEIPSNEYLAQKVEECEQNEPLASTLDEVTSKQDTTTASLQSSLDAGGHVRITKMKVKGKMPDSSEELRRALKVEAITWLCMASKFKAKAWLAGLELRDWLRYIDHLLGDRVFGLKIPVDGVTQLVRPSWTIIISYEHKLRKEAFKLVNNGEATLKQALERVTKDADIKEGYFTTPIALTSSQGSKWRRMNSKGEPGNPTGAGFQKGKGKGKFQKKGKSREDNRDFNGSALVANTPDGRELCFAYNAQGCKGKCGRVHACRVHGCYQQHSAREHDKYVKSSSENNKND